jgi:hypothetical protein
LIRHAGEYRSDADRRTCGYLVLDLHERCPGDVVRWLENGLVAALADLGSRRGPVR